LRALPGSDPRLPELEIQLGELRFREGRFEEAEELLESGIRRMKAGSNPDRALAEEATDRLGTVYDRQGRSEEAARTHRDVLAKRTERLGADHLDTATTAARLGDSLLDLRSFDESQILLLQAESVYEVRGQAYVTNRAAIQSSLGRLYRSVGRYAEAERRYRRAIELASQYNAARNPNIALYTRSLADLYLVTGRKDEARNLYQQALASQESMLGRHDPETEKTRKALLELH
jgi:tetratricopeptide (TPR) repeat protein